MSAERPPLTPSEIERLLAASPEQRLAYLIETAAAHEELWGLEREDGWVRFAMPHGLPAVFPLWPAQEFAALASAGEEEQPRRLELEELLEFVLPELSRGEMSVAAFPHAGTGIVLAAGVLSEKLAQAWEEGD